MDAEYFLFENKKDAENFYLKALGYGIWANFELGKTNGLHCVRIDKEKTWEAIYAKTEE